jgi:molybdate transport system substrate-binding protein
VEAAVAKLKVMCARSMHVAVGALGRAFAERSGHTVEFDFGTVGALEAKLDTGETADVLMLSVPAMDKLDQAGALAPRSRRDIARTFIAVCIRAGAPKPDFATVESFRRMLENARAIAISDPAVGGSAGVHLARTFEQAGLATMLQTKQMPQRTGAEVARCVAEGKAELGLTLSGEIASVEGAAIAGAVPPPFGQDTTYCAAVMAGSGETEAGVAFIAALMLPATRETWAKAGFEVPW